MISSFIKYSITFFIFFVFLSIPLNKKPLFVHLHEVTHPMTKSIIHNVEEKTLSALTGLKDFGKKLFSNATPIYADSVKVKKSSIQRALESKPKKEELLEVKNSVWDIEDEEDVQQQVQEQKTKKVIKKAKFEKEDHSIEDQKELQQLLKSKS